MKARAILVGLGMATVAGFELAPQAQAVPVVTNGSFEADAYANAPGYTSGNGGTITGWTLTGTGHGINPTTGGSTPFANNGTIPDGSQVLFIQGPQAGANNAVSQLVSGFDSGRNYIMTYRENSRNFATNPIGVATFAGTNVVAAHTVAPVAAVNTAGAYRYVGSAVAAPVSPSNTISLESVAAGGDHTVLYDKVAVTEIYLAFGDNFNALANSNNINPSANDEPGRQTGYVVGMLGPINYTETAHSSGGAQPHFSQLDNGEYPDALLLAAGGGGGNPTIVSPNYNFKDSGPGGTHYVVEAQVNATNQGAASSWVSMAVIGSSNQLASVNTSDGVGFLIRGNGGYQIFDGTSGANVLEKSSDLGTEFGIDETGFYDVRINYFVSAFDDVSKVLVAITVDNILVHSFQTDSGFANNFINLVGEADSTALTTHGIDNFKVWSTTAVPEPVTASLLGLASVVLLARRRRAA